MVIYGDPGAHAIVALLQPRRYLLRPGRLKHCTHGRRADALNPKPFEDAIELLLELCLPSPVSRKDYLGACRLNDPAQLLQLRFLEVAIHVAADHAIDVEENRGMRPELEEKVIPKGGEGMQLLNEHPRRRASASMLLRRVSSHSYSLEAPSEAGRAARMGHFQEVVATHDSATRSSHGRAQ